MTVDLAARLREIIARPLPLPGSGETFVRWEKLAGYCIEDIATGRLVEAHGDADAILYEIDGRRAAVGELWGVWAAEPPKPVLTATPVGDHWRLEGTKLWCSGASLCTHALVTAIDGDKPRLFTVDLRQDGVHPGSGTWANVGMRASDTESVSFRGVPAQAVGGPASYLERPGFWHGAIGVAACWYGGAVAVSEALKDRLYKADPHQLAHMGAVDAALAGARWSLMAAATEIDADPRDESGQAQLRARRVRVIVENAATVAIEHVGRALGAGPLCQDATHAQRVADLTVYLRQSHGDADLADLAGLLT